jgi:hypothetical protein
MIMKLKAVCAHGLLAFSLFGAVGAASAAPIYHVSLDTHTLSGTGYLDLTFSTLGNAAAATTTLSNFAGDFRAGSMGQGIVSGDVGSMVTFGNTETFNELLQAVNYGGLFSFDVNFAVAATGDIGTDFGVALTNAALDDYAPGTGGNLVVIGLMPGSPDTVSAVDRFATVTTTASNTVAAVPEPATAALLAFGLLLLPMRRGRNRSPR